MNFLIKIMLNFYDIFVRTFANIIVMMVRQYPMINDNKQIITRYHENIFVSIDILCINI